MVKQPANQIKLNTAYDHLSFQKGKSFLARMKLGQNLTFNSSKLPLEKT